MKRMLLSALGAVAAVLFAAPLVAGAQVPTEDSVTGTIDVFEFDAHSGPSGENPRGTVDLVSGASRTRAPVTCLAVMGNRATIGINFPVGGGAGLLWFVEDNDGAGSDRAILNAADGVPAVCPANPPTGVALRPIRSGDIEVTDAQPFPTSKEQCKHGGWRNFPGFKNEGQCVAFVERGPKAKNPP